MRKTGKYESHGSLQCFVPDPLPPQDPPFTFNTSISTLYGQAMQSLGQLNGMIGAIPDTRRFINAYIIKEAILSSEIEGIHTTLLEVFTQPFSSSRPRKETQLVLNYKDATDHALDLIIGKEYPITSRILREAHAILLHQSPGDPGHFRKQQVRVGNLIPAPAPEIANLMADLERFINDDQTLPDLIKAGLAHLQFETIHPFLDGNGRIGRLLIVLMLVKNKMLMAPLIYPSYYFKKYSIEYYRSLDRVRTVGDFEGWISFYLRVIKESGTDAYLRAGDIQDLSARLTTSIKDQKFSAKMEQLRLDALALLFSFPTITAAMLEKELSISYNTARQIIAEFQEQSILTGDNYKKRGAFFSFHHYIAILEKEYSV